MSDTIYEMARDAGKSGRSYIDWVNSDEVQAVIDALPNEEVDFDGVEVAFCEGLRSSWRTAWTTAPEAYDGFGTATVESHQDFHGQVLRKVSIDPRFYAWQEGRYGSGCKGVWEEDPRLIEARTQADLTAERERADRDRALRLEGLAWLPTADAALLEMTDENYDVWHARGLRTEDVRAERDRRRADAEAARRKALWERCAALIPVGRAIVDPGTPGSRGLYGWTRGRDPNVWLDVKIVPGSPADDPDEASVVGEGGEHVGHLTTVAKYLEDGSVRAALPDEAVPPIAVMKRIGHRDLKRIHRVEVGGGEYWVGRPAFGDRMVLDSKGHLARSKAVKEAALAASPSGY